MFNVKKNKIKLSTEGTHKAALVWLYGLGTQHSDQFNTDREEILIMFELLDENLPSGDPFTLSKTYTRSLNERSSLTRDFGSQLLNEEGDELDISTLLGRNMNVLVEHKESKGKVWAVVSSVVPLSKNEKQIKPKSELRVFDFQSPIPEGTPEWIVAKIKASPEWDRYLKGQEEVFDATPVETPTFDNKLEPFLGQGR